jgi:hypothetical protein
MCTPGSEHRWLTGRLGALTAAAVLMATMASCEATLPSPCGLLTVEQIENETGSQVGPPNGDEYLDSGGLLCVWIQVPSSPSSYQLSLSIHPFSSSDWNAIRATDGTRPVAGLGQEAYFVPGPVGEGEYDPLGAGLHVRQDSLQLTLLRVNTRGVSEGEGILVELARLALIQMAKHPTVTAPPQAPPGPG